MSDVAQRGVPAYKTLADGLRTAINRGSYPSGHRLPTEFELAEQHGVSRQTVRQAFSELVAQGLVYRVRGRGTFAVPATSKPGSYLKSFGSIDELLALSVDTQLILVRPFVRQTDVDAAGRLRLNSDDVLVGTFQRVHQDVAYCVSTVYLPPELAPIVQDEPSLSAPGIRSAVTIIGLIERDGSHPVIGAHQSVTSVPASDEVAELIECEPEAPVLRIDRLYYDRAGAFVELAVSHFNPARYSYRVELRRASLAPYLPAS